MAGNLDAWFRSFCGGAGLPDIELGPGDVFEIPPGHDAWVVGDQPWVSVDFEAMRTFGRQPDARDERILATMVFTDIVDSTRSAREVGAARAVESGRPCGRLSVTSGPPCRTQARQPSSID